MKVVGLRELHRSTGDVVKRLEEGGEPFVITRRGQAVAVLFPCANNAPMQPVVSLDPPLPVPEGLELQVFQAVDETQKTTDRIASQIGLSSKEVAPTLSRLELRGFVSRGLMGYGLSEKGAALAEWMQNTEA
jgi:prevent-host-death family protein